MKRACRRCGGTDRYKNGTCVACNTEFSKKRYLANKEEWFVSRLRRTYGITIEQFEEMLEVQAGLCAICTEPMVPGKGTHVDHCHSTGRVRGLLCQHCNRGLGYFRDSPLLLEGAAPYLKAS